MGLATATTVKLHAALYTEAAISEAAAVFADFASFAVHRDGTHYVVEVTGIKDGTALITGGLALDEGLLAGIREEMVNEKVDVTAVSHPDSIYAGAIGAALWGAFRHGKLRELQQRAAA